MFDRTARWHRNRQGSLGESVGGAVGMAIKEWQDPWEGQWQPMQEIILGGGPDIKNPLAHEEVDRGMAKDRAWGW